ncbi:response regulator [Sphingobium sp. H39-3-25]|uniref:response regulator transcription factor n=1 Tax=Sphingobium arseniciresistens TaxID=3030834 RepID=UPI0023BA2263|nr:response regulator [Sphingobium arseniciresistens]
MSAPFTIAIVDDDPDVRGSLDSLMRSAGFMARCFASAEALLCDAAYDALGCIVTDVHMPGMDGLDLQAEIARRGWTKPMIVMTAYPTETARERAMAAGALAFLTKPVDPDMLLEAIEKVVLQDR